MIQDDLFSVPLAEAARDEAVQRVQAHTDPDWAMAARGALRQLAYRHPTVTSEDVWFALSGSEHSTHEPRAMAGVMAWGKAGGLIRATAEFRQGERVSRHRAPIRVWRSLVYPSQREGAA